MARHDTSRKPSVVFQHTALLTLPDRNNPPIEALSRLSSILQATHRSLSGVRRLRVCVTQSRDWLRNLKTGTQSRDSENVQCNLEIAQILRLRGTRIFIKRL